MMQSKELNSIKNSNSLENKENLEPNGLIREVPSLVIPFLCEKPPVDNLKDVISKINQTLTEESKKLKFKKLKKTVSGSSDVSWSNDSSSSEESAISSGDDRDDELVKAIAANKRNSFSFDDGTNKEFFEKPIGSLLMSIGQSLANEQFAISLYREKTVLEKESSKTVDLGIKSIVENIKKTEVENLPFKFKFKSCEFCKFKTESALVMANHYETPHRISREFRCNFCKFADGSQYKIKFHMETVHNVKARIQKKKHEKNFQCDFCEFDSPLQFVIDEHLNECKKRFNLKRNLVPPADWEPPAKIQKEFSSVVKKEVLTKVEIATPLPPLAPFKLFPTIEKEVVKKIEIKREVLPVIKKIVVQVRLGLALQNK